MRRRSTINVELGDLFVRRENTRVVWRVARKSRTPDGINHVLLERLDQPDTTKLLAYTMLSKGRDFQRIGHQGVDLSAPLNLFEAAPLGAVERVPG